VVLELERQFMGQAIMDPEQVRRFAEELKRFNTDLQDRVASLQARFAALGDTWQDEEHAKFADEFRQTMKALKKFVESSNQQTPYLMRKAQRIEEYLNQR
jgi:uncharacterized protein YukE